MNRTASHCLLAVALAAVIASAFAHGGETLGGQGLVLAAGAGAFAGMALAPTVRWPLSIRMAGLAWIALITWCSIQAAPLGFGAHPAWQEAGAILGSQEIGAIVLDPLAARDSAWRLTAYAGLFLLGFSAAPEAHTVTTWVALAIAAVVTLSLVIGADTVGPAGLAKVRHWGDAAFPFANRNHFCIFVGIGALTALAALLMQRDFPRWRTALLVAALATCLSAAFATHSRAGLAALAAGSAAMLILALPNRRMRTVAAAIACVCALTFAAGTLARLETLSEAAALRLDIVGEAFRLSLQRPLLGQGSFDLAFQAVSPAYPQGMVQSAHNILAESLVERGWPATALAALALLLVVGQCARSTVGSGAGRVQPATAIGVATMVLLHGMVDFSVHAPTIAALVAIVLGLGAGTSCQPAPVSAVKVACGTPPEGARA